MRMTLTLTAKWEGNVSPKPDPKAEGGRGKSIKQALGKGLGGAHMKEKKALGPRPWA